MLTLYHFPAAICAQKNRVCLAEKGVKWTSVDASKILRTPEYLKLNPGGYAPTLVHDDRVITESRIISEYIDESFEGPPLQPSDPYLRSISRNWSKQVDDSLHPTIFILTFVPNSIELKRTKSKEELVKTLPLEIQKRERALNMLEFGYKSPYILPALQRIQKLISDMQATFSQTQWLAGDSYTLADADITPYFQRLTDLGLDWFWEDRPAVRAWHDRVQRRPSFSAVKKDWFSETDLEKSAVIAKSVGAQFRELLAAAA
jgi:glutathione S-transferase